MAKKIKRECDCCKNKATHRVIDSFYNYLCDKCFEQWEEDYDYSWDESEY